jgi:curved DNA-binding protein CbpA
MSPRTQTFTFYELLGVTERADTETITRAFRKLAKLYHPDSNPDGGAETAEMFKALVAAYDTLRDDGLRASYDAELRAEREGGVAPEPELASEPPPPRPRTTGQPPGGAGSYAHEYFGSVGPSASEMIARLRLINSRWRIVLWWTPSVIGFPFFAWLEARRITRNPRYTRLLAAYLLALFVIGAINQTGLLALYWLVGMAHVLFQNRAVKAQAIARLASRRY